MNISQTHKTYLIIGHPDDRSQIIKNLLERFKLNSQKNSLDLEIIEAPKTKITINQIRKIKKDAYLKPYRNIRTIIIKDAHNLSTVAQNALLKLLEEPPNNLLIILEAQTKNQLLSTVLSRVTIIQGKLKHATSNENLNSFDIESALIELSKIKEPKEWIDNQIEKNYQKLLSNINSNNKESTIKNIENLAFTKKLIEANVNTQFALANYILGLEPILI